MRITQFGTQQRYTDAYVTLLIVATIAAFLSVPMATIHLREIK